MVEAGGDLDRLARSAARLSQRSMILSLVVDGSMPNLTCRRIGAPLLFERLWQESGCRAVVEGLLAARRFEFAVERAVFLTVLHRLMVSGSDRACEHWRDDYHIDDIDGLDLHHLYRAMSWLGEELPATEQAVRTHAPRCIKDLVEERLFARQRDLFSELSVVFMDTTTLYFEGRGGDTLGQRGHTKDYRPHLNQMVVGIIMDQNGRPVCSEMWPGNTTDVITLIPVIDRLRQRFAVGRVCIVADRGMISTPREGVHAADDGQSAVGLERGRLELPMQPRHLRQRNFRLTDDDVHIVRQLARHRFLKSTHIAALVGRSLDRTNDRLLRLFHAGYINRPRAQLDYYPTAGSSPIAYALADRGARLLIRRDGIEFANVEPKEPQGRPSVHRTSIGDRRFLGRASARHRRSTRRAIHPPQRHPSLASPSRRAPPAIRCRLPIRLLPTPTTCRVLPRDRPSCRRSCTADMPGVWLDTR